MVALIKQFLIEKKKLILIVVISVAMIFVGFKAFKEVKHYRWKTEQINLTISIAEEYGLENVTVECPGYVMNIDSSNIDELSGSEIISLHTKLEEGLFGCNFTSNGDEYEVYKSTRSVYKNGKSIYDDYENSESKKNYVASKKEKNEKTQNNYERLKEEFNASKSTTSSSENSSSSEEATDSSELGACWALAEQTVKGQLKSPSSAKFPFSYISDGVSITKSGSTYTVVGWVEAENSFGATSKQNFIVTMEKSGYGSNAKFTAQTCSIY